MSRPNCHMSRLDFCSNWYRSIILENDISTLFWWRKNSSNQSIQKYSSRQKLGIFSTNCLIFALIDIDPSSWNDNISTLFTIRKISSNQIIQKYSSWQKLGIFSTNSLISALIDIDPSSWNDNISTLFWKRKTRQIKAFKNIRADRY